MFGDRDFCHTLHGVRVARAAWSSDVAQEGLHGREWSLHVDEDRAIAAVRHGADHAVTMGRFRDPGAVVYALDAAAGDTVPVDNAAHGPLGPNLPRARRTSGPWGS